MPAFACTAAVSDARFFFTARQVKQQPAAGQLKNKAGDADSEILAGKPEITFDGPLAQGADDLIAENHGGEDGQRGAAIAVCSRTGDNRQQYRLDQYGRQSRNSGHAEKQSVHHR